MARLKKVDLFPGYERTDDVDYTFLATAFAVAKGRTSIRDFAQECGTSGATISRIINMQINAPISDSLIKAVSERLPEDSGITLDTLLKANGLRAVTIEDVSEDESLEMIKRRNVRALSAQRGQILEKTAREVIQNELLEKGYSLSVEQRAFESSINFMCDFAFKTDALKELGIERWEFDVKFGNSIHSMHSMNALFASCYVNRPLSAKTKISVVVFEENYFNSLKRRYSDICIPDYISIILIDMNERCVVEEFNISTDKKNIEIFKGGKANE